MKYKAVIFDLFGTLVDNFTETEYERVLGEMANALGAPADEFSREWRESFYLRTNGSHRTHEESIRYICDRLGISVTEEQVDLVSEIRLDYTRRTLVPRHASIPVINELKASGYRVGLISDCSHEAPKVWLDTPFKGIFDDTVFSCVVSLKKPDPRIYLLACSNLGVKPEEVLYVGDGSSNELTGAAAVGMHPVQIQDPGETEDTHFVDKEQNWQGPVISSLYEVLDIVKYTYQA